MVTASVTEVYVREFRIDYRRLKRVRAALAALTVDVAEVAGHRASWVKRLGELRDQLAIHFALEEACDYGGEIREMAPHLAGRAERLKREHLELYDRICRITEVAERFLLETDHPRRDDLRTGNGDARSLVRLVRSVQDFERRLAVHEASDDALLLDAIETDFGGED